jgi:hypothetical protein
MINLFALYRWGKRFFLIGITNHHIEYKRIAEAELVPLLLSKGRIFQ